MSKAIGIIGAMDIEVNGLKSLIKDPVVKEFSGIQYYSGSINGKEVVVAKCGVGKVFAAVCAQTMILNYSIKIIINIGVSGGYDNSLNIGDIVVGTKVVQHDMDTSAVGDPKGLVSGINKIFFDCDASFNTKIDDMKGFDIKKGIVASGDQFLCDRISVGAIYAAFGAIAFDMESASIGQVCFINNVPFGIIRTISDNGDSNPSFDYLEFCDSSAKKSIKLISAFLNY